MVCHAGIKQAGGRPGHVDESLRADQGGPRITVSADTRKPSQGHKQLLAAKAVYFLSLE